MTTTVAQLIAALQKLPQQTNRKHRKHKMTNEFKPTFREYIALREQFKNLNSKPGFTVKEMKEAAIAWDRSTQSIRTKQIDKYKKIIENIQI